RPSGMEPDSPEWKAYLSRAVFYGVTGRTLEGILGTVFRKGPKQLEVPRLLEARLEDLTPDGVNFITFARRIVRDQTALGRFGVLVDIRPNAGPTEAPRLAGYEAESIHNWTWDL